MKGSADDIASSAFCLNLIASEDLHKKIPMACQFAIYNYRTSNFQQRRSYCRFAVNEQQNGGEFYAARI